MGNSSVPSNAMVKYIVLESGTSKYKPTITVIFKSINAAATNQIINVSRFDAYTNGVVYIAATSYFNLQPHTEFLVIDD
ncbi:MAG: hypothetical protein HNEKOMLI_00773 [Sodalis sp. Psp]|nr:hypothetical protein [Sodalis sp. Psp]MCR3757249.1 hypothetical protein [Sodalis sp. Ppy]